VLVCLRERHHGRAQLGVHELVGDGFEVQGVDLLALALPDSGYAGHHGGGGGHDGSLPDRVLPAVLHFPR